MEKQSFSLKLLSGDFYGQSFIKTVRGPLVNLQQHVYSNSLRPFLNSLPNKVPIRFFKYFFAAVQFLRQK